MPRLPAVLFECPQHEVPEVVYCCCKNCTGCVASIVWRHRWHTRSTVKMTQLPSAFGEQLLPNMLLSHVQHEAMIRGGNVRCWV